METKRKLEWQSLFSDKIDFKIKNILTDKERLYNDQGINPRRRHNNCKYLCTQHRSTSIHKTNTNRHKRTSWRQHNNIGGFNKTLTSMDRSSKHRINKGTQVLNDTLNEVDLIDIFRTLHPNTEEYSFFSRAHGTFSRIDHILGHKSNLTKCKKTEIISSIFPDHNTMTLDINQKKKL